MCLRSANFKGALLKDLENSLAQLKQAKDHLLVSMCNDTPAVVEQRLNEARPLSCFDLPPEPFLAPPKLTTPALDQSYLADLLEKVKYRERGPTCS